MKTVINNIVEFLGHKGETLDVSKPLLITQQVINNFADATRDHQWIHVDVNKARSDSNFGCTIAHGYLIVSLIPSFLDDILEVKNVTQVVNYGIEKFTFKKIVKVNSQLRMTAFLKSVRDLGTLCKATITCIFDTDDSNEPVAEGDITFLYYFN